MEQHRSIALLGAGGVATQLGYALRGAGYEVRGVFSRQATHAAELAAKLDCPLSTAHIEALPEADVTVVSISDDAVEQAARTWASSHEAANHLLLHTAGCVPLSKLTSYAPEAAVLYPMQTFSKARRVDFKEVPVFVEGSTPEALQKVTTLARSISGNVTTLDTERRKQLHLAAVFACNFPNHCYTLAYELLERAQIDPTCLLPLIDETAHKVHTLSPWEAQTGPAVRGDERAMGRHLELLSGQPELKALYQMMSASIRKAHETHSSL